MKISEYHPLGLLYKGCQIFNERKYDGTKSCFYLLYTMTDLPLAYDWYSVSYILGTLNISSEFGA